MHKPLFLAVYTALTASLAVPAIAQSRPPITGISHMCVYAADPSASAAFYTHDLGATPTPDPQDAAGKRFLFSPSQFVEVLPLPADHTLSRISCIAFTTPDVPGLRAYLQGHNVPSGALKTASDGTRWFAATDPEGNTVQFLEAAHSPAPPPAANPISTRIIHVGFLVHSQAAEDPFYRTLLGFRPYWYGAMTADHKDWVSQQVPDGHDWLEYMLVGDGSDVPVDKVDARTLGVLNHFSLGVPNMEQAVTTLYAGDRLPPRHDGPQMGKDGKWQANLYDPDGTRVELMEFQPVITPCCSQFTAESPMR